MKAFAVIQDVPRLLQSFPDLEKYIGDCDELRIEIMSGISSAFVPFNEQTKQLFPDGEIPKQFVDRRVHEL